jgi:hypothetical protein
VLEGPSRLRLGALNAVPVRGMRLLASEQGKRLLKVMAGVRGRTYTGKCVAGGTTATLVALAMLPAFAAPANAAGGYVFTKVVDSADGFNPNTLSGSCPSINTGGDIAFKSERGGQDGIHRANAGGGVTTIADEGSGFTLFANGSPSMNDSGQVSFGASPSDGGQAIMRGDGGPLTEIASTSADGFTSFGRNTSINDVTGEVAFDGQLSSGASGLFSGTGGEITTHYQDDQAATVDGSPATFNATSDRPSINNVGDIAFLDEIRDTFRQDIFRGQEGSFRTISASNRPSADTPPLLNDGGTVIWQTQFLDDTGFAVRAIVKGDGVGADTNVVDSSGAFNLFEAYAMNKTGAVAFSARMDEGDLGIPSVFVGPNAKKDRVIGPGDKLDGGTVVGLNFCEEGLNDSGQLAFVAEIEDRNGDVRVAVFRATAALKK